MESPQCLHRLCEAVLPLLYPLTPSEGVCFSRHSPTPLEGVESEGMELEGMELEGTESKGVEVDN